MFLNPSFSIKKKKKEEKNNTNSPSIIKWRCQTTDQQTLVRSYSPKCIIIWHDENRLDLIQVMLRKHAWGSFQISFIMHDRPSRVPRSVSRTHSEERLRGSRVSLTPSLTTDTVRSLLSFIWTRVRFFFRRAIVWIAWTSLSSFHHERRDAVPRGTCDVQAWNLWLPRQQSGQTFETRIDLGGIKMGRECAKFLSIVSFFVCEFLHISPEFEISGHVENFEGNNDPWLLGESLKWVSVSLQS